MTKAGYKSVTIPISLHSVLQYEAINLGISISGVIERGVKGGFPLTDNRKVLRSNRSGPTYSFMTYGWNLCVGISHRHQIKP